MHYNRARRALTDGVTQSQTEAVNANEPVRLLIFYAVSFQFRSEVTLFLLRFPDIEFSAV